MGNLRMPTMKEVKNQLALTIQNMRAVSNLTTLLESLERGRARQKVELDDRSLKRKAKRYAARVIRNYNELYHACRVRFSPDRVETLVERAYLDGHRST